MKHSFLMLAFFVLTGSASAQISDALNRNPVKNKVIPNPKTIRICAPSRAGIIANAPLWVVNEVVVNAELITPYIRPSNIESVTVLKDTSAMSLYGASAKNGVIKISLKKNLKLWNLEELFKNFKIKQKNQNLPVFIDEKRLITYTDFYIVNEIVASVKVVPGQDELPGKNKVIKISLKPL